MPGLLLFQRTLHVEAQCQALIERAVAEYGRIDTLINNAGISMYARFDELGTVEPLERVMRINYFGSIYCTHHALPIEAEPRRIVAVSSLAGKTGFRCVARTRPASTPWQASSTRCVLSSQKTELA